jgi:NAD+ synthase (glutamine-hydrolysing)
VVFPELAITGYPPQDLLFRKSFVKENRSVLYKIVDDKTKSVVIVGFVDSDSAGNMYNAAALFEGPYLVGIVHKTLLPTYDVFDEARYFQPSKKTAIQPINVVIGNRPTQLGIEICEDMWDQAYNIKVTNLLAQRGAELIVNISASPFYVSRSLDRARQVREKAINNSLPFFYVNLVGGQGELVFDGQSFAVDRSGNFLAFAKSFEEDLVTIDIALNHRVANPLIFPSYDKEKEMFSALVLGVRDYFRKTGFKKAVVGMSGGIDSSVTTCIAVTALGKDNVIGVSMPSRFSSAHSKTDAETLSKTLGICFVQFPIHDVVKSYRRTLAKPLNEIRRIFATKTSRDDPVADENIQPRVRGNCLMDISNRLKDLRILVLNTGNKTELALGYCTLYGDMTGGLAPLGDVSKLQVYKLAEYVNRAANKEIIPRNVFKKKPSPELKEDQYDPFDFDIVSPLVDLIIENYKSKQELIELGYPKKVVEDVYHRIRRAEYKRRQAPPCLKITRQAFGIGWKMPIVNQYNR